MFTELRFAHTLDVNTVGLCGYLHAYCMCKYVTKAIEELCFER